VVAGEAALFAMLMRRHNRRVYRTVRGILRDDTEAEDVAQDVWIAAYRALESFEGRAAFSTWLTRIAIRRALARASRAREVRTLDELDQLSLSDDAPGPDWETYRHEIARVLEAARRDP
jgi:RNA polymerase sigma-70 factor (ECF subfamily)